MITNQSRNTTTLHLIYTTTIYIDKPAVLATVDNRKFYLKEN